ncbi:MAG: SCO family protein [Alphaproteobacteria bacterium]|nr:SCO family protein [Alphaproteobacteria bacterium]
MQKKHLIRMAMGGLFLCAAIFMVRNIAFVTDVPSAPGIAQVRYQKGNSPVSIGGPFLLVDQHGRPKSSADFRGRYMLVYFGYTYCPDVCPTALYAMTDALNSLKDKAKNFQPIFITIDPNRDTRSVMRDYMKNFHPSFVGLTGEKDQLEKAHKAYHVYAVKAPGQEHEKNYILDHSSIVYVMDPRGRFITSFNHNTSAEEIVKILLTLS